jgi:predicted transposase YbfD/YdcC
MSNIDTNKWLGLKTLIQVHRKVIFKNKVTEETAYFISSLSKETKAKIFNVGIRSHWSVESFHYIKDKTFLEDSWTARTKSAAANYSLIRNFCINTFRKNSLNKIQEAIERCANNVSFMMGLF